MVSARDVASDGELLRQLFENADDGIFLLSRDGKFIGANAKWGEIAGRRVDEMIGQTMEILRPGGFPESLERLERILRDGRFGPYELEIATPSGMKIVSLNAFALVENGQRAGAIEIARDVTAEREATAAIREARDEALEASRRKSAFLANTSHEVRNLLNVVLGYSSLLTEIPPQTAPEDRQLITDGIKRAGNRLKQTIDRILDVSKIEAGSFTVMVARVKLGPLIARHARDFRHYAGERGVSLVHDAAEPNVMVEFDPYCLDSALMNLIGNAIKFTPKGGEVRIEQSRDGGRRPCIRVRDNGVGIDPQFLQKLAEPFVRAHEAFALEGAGLGLALTKTYLALNAAWFSVESKKGRGSTFTIHFTTEVRPSDPAAIAFDEKL